MVDVKVFKSLRRKERDHELVSAISRQGCHCVVYPEVMPADVSVVVSGLYENPSQLTGKKVLAFDATEWFPKMPVPKGFNLFAPVLKHYYDEVLNLSHMDVEQKAKAISRL